MIPVSWNANYVRYIQRPNFNYEIKLGKQRRNGFDANLGEERYNVMLNCLMSHFGADKSDAFVTRAEQDTTKVYASNCALSRKYDARMLVSSTQQSKKTVCERHTHKFMHAYFALELSMVKLDDAVTYEFQIRLDDIEYCRKHSPEFILSGCVAELQNLLTSSNI